MAEQNAPDRWQSFVSHLPEQYRDKPEDFVGAWETAQRDLSEARSRMQDAARYEDWYRNTYAPWAQANQPLLQEFDQWKRSGRGSQPPAQGTQPAAEQGAPATSEIDWDDPDAPRRAFEVLARQVDNERNQRLVMEGVVAQKEQALTGLIGLLEEARQLQSDMPYANMTEVAKYAADHGLRDLRLAADQVYRDRQLEERVQQEVARARQQWEQEQANRHIHTEGGPGTRPRSHAFRDHAPTERGYGHKGLDGLYNAIQQKVPDAPWN